LKILILTQYFPPEIGAPQNRLLDLAIKLSTFGAEVSVLTAFPNYPQYRIHEGYRGKFYQKELFDGLTVYRSWIYVTTSKTIISRLLNYFSFCLSSLFIGLTKTSEIDLIICESPPLLLGATAVLLKQQKKARLVFNVSDLWPESAVKLGLVNNKLIIKVSYALEHWIYRQANQISGQTQGIIHSISSRITNKKVFWLRNGIDPQEVEERLTQADWRKNQGFAKDDFLVYFGGLMGYAQGLEVIMESAWETKDNKRIKYILIGDGPEKQKLLELQKKMVLSNVYIYQAVSRFEIIDVIKGIDAAIIPLRKIDLFKGAIPSKIFEILYMKKPLLLGVAGEALQIFVKDAQAGLPFEPENGADLASRVNLLADNPQLSEELGKNGHKYIMKNFNRNQIAQDFWNFIQFSNDTQTSSDTTNH